MSANSLKLASASESVFFSSVRRINLFALQTTHTVLKERYLRTTNDRLPTTKLTLFTTFVYISSGGIHVPHLPQNIPICIGGVTTPTRRLP